MPIVGELVVAHGDAADLLDAAEESLDEIALTIDGIAALAPAASMVCPDARAS
jgi:hypothetical protein